LPFNNTLTKSLRLIDIDQPFPFFNAVLTCPSGDAGVHISADVKAKIDAKVSFIATGRLVPPLLTRLALISSQ
jgi:hypothetical protein